MEKLIKKINLLREDEVSDLIILRLKEFKEASLGKDRVFSELCFCLLTANFQAQKSWDIQKKLENDFFVSSVEDLALKLKELGHRFWPQRAERIFLVRDIYDELFFMLQEKGEKEIRDWIVLNVKGLGMKEASHFLRNIGFFDVAIIDFHIVDLLVEEGLIKKPKTITKKVYLEIEEVLRELAKKVNMSLGELDLYLWYIETGKVLK